MDWGVRKPPFPIGLNPVLLTPVPCRQSGGPQAWGVLFCLVGLQVQEGQMRAFDGASSLPDSVARRRARSRQQRSRVTACGADAEKGWPIIKQLGIKAD